MPDFSLLAALEVLHRRWIGSEHWPPFTDGLRATETDRAVRVIWPHLANLPA